MPIKIPNSTLEIQERGRGRLSPDLVGVSGSYVWKLDRERKKLILDGRRTIKGDRLKVWAARRDKSKSGMISLVSVIRGLGMTPEEMEGKLLDVTVEGKKLEVQF